jgi:O-antigen ligase
MTEEKHLKTSGWNAWLEAGLGLLAFLLPWQTRLIIRPGELGGFWEYGTISLYATDLVFLACLLLAVLARRSLFTPWRRYRWLFLFLLLAMWPALLASNWLLGLHAWLRLGQGVLLLALFASVVNKRRLAVSLLAGLGSAAVLGIAQFVVQAAPACKWLGLSAHLPSVAGVSVVESTAGRWLRAYGSFDHPNIFGLAMALAAVLNLRLASIFRRYRLALVLLAGLFGLALALSFSRAAWLAAGLGVVLTVAVASYRRLLIVPVLVMLTLFLLPLVAMPELAQSRLSGSGRLEQLSNQERLDYLGQAGQIIRQEPGGVGLGHYTWELARRSPGEPAYAYQPVHNTFLLVLAEAGWLVGIAWLVFLASVAWQLVAARQWWGLAVLAVMLLGMLLDHWWWSLHAGLMLLWPWLGLLLGECPPSVKNAKLEAR